MLAYWHILLSVLSCTMSTRRGLKCKTLSTGRCWWYWQRSVECVMLLKEITRNQLILLHASPRLQKAIPEKPVVAYRRTKHLRDLLVFAELKPPSLLPSLGTSPCGNKRCLTCTHILTGTTVHSTVAGCSFKVRATVNCNVVYVIQCRRCAMQYVGETKNPLHIRLNGHCSDITHRHLEKPVLPCLFCPFFPMFLFSPACSFLPFPLSPFFSDQLIFQFCPYSSLVFLKFLLYCLVTVIEHSRVTVISLSPSVCTHLMKTARSKRCESKFY